MTHGNAMDKKDDRVNHAPEGTSLGSPSRSRRPEVEVTPAPAPAARAAEPVSVRRDRLDELKGSRFTIIVGDSGGKRQRLAFKKAEVTIGRLEENDIVLSGSNVSQRHSRIILRSGKCVLTDLKSADGTYVNGRKITGALVIKGSDKIHIGDFVLNVEGPDSSVVAGSVMPNMAPAAGADEPPMLEDIGVQLDFGESAFEGILESGSEVLIEDVPFEIEDATAPNGASRRTMKPPSPTPSWESAPAPEATPATQRVVSPAGRDLLRRPKPPEWPTEDDMTPMEEMSHELSELKRRLQYLDDHCAELAHKLAESKEAEDMIWSAVGLVCDKCSAEVDKLNDHLMRLEEGLRRARVRSV